MQPKNFLLLATSTKLFNTKNLSNRYCCRHFISQSFKPKQKTFNLLNINFYFKRQLTTEGNISKAFLYQPSAQKSPPYDTTSQQHQATPHESHHHIHNISQVYPAHDDSTSTQQQSRDKPSLMILIGWWNCKPKYLRKYVSLYTDKFHIDTLSHIPPFYHVFFPWTIPRDINRLAKELIIIWIERGKPNNIGFHVFSNNGTYHYAILCEAIRNLSKNCDQKQITLSSDDTESFLNSIKSCVIDSAPSPITEKYLALGIIGGFLRRALIEKSEPTISNSNYGNEEVSIIKPPPFLISVLSIFFALSVVKRYQDVAHKSLYNIPGGIRDGRKIKYLFLYGPGDQIVPEEEVIEFMSRLKERESDVINSEKKGVLKIVRKRFGAGSEHVQHFLRYPDEYISVLKSFYNIK